MQFLKNKKWQRTTIWALLACMFLATLVAAYFVVENAVKNTVEQQALSVAQIVAAGATTARSVYAKEIAGKLQADGTGPHANSEQMPGYVPIPAQFLKMIGLATTANSANLFRYQPVSKWNLEPTQGIADGFLAWAWPQLEKQDQAFPKGPIDWKPIWRFETQSEQQGGKKMLRYLYADPASQASCVTCHNNYEGRPDVVAQRRAAHVLPGKHWQQHQLMGALSITIPLERVETAAGTQIRATSIFVFGLLLPVFLVAGGFNIRLARQDRTLKATEKQLENTEHEARNANVLLLAKQGVERAFAELSTYLQAIDQHALVSVIDPSGRIIQVNDKFCQMSGYSQKELTEQNRNMSDSYAHTREFYAGLWKVIERGDIWKGEVCSRAKSGDLHWLDSAIVPLKDDAGRIDRYISIQIDCTERKQAEEQLRIAAAAFESQEGMMVTDTQSVILRVNRAFTELTGYTAEEVVGQKSSLLQSGRHNQDFYREMWETIHRTGGWQGEVWDRRKNGEEYPKWLTISAVKADDGAVTHYIGAHFDISARKHAEEKINELAFFDQLTGLPNRTLLLDRLRQTMTASSRTGSFGALLFIDLDNFKTLNDTLGHDMGDLLLKKVAQRLTTCVRAGDTVARLGGDEFVVMLAGLSVQEREAATQTEFVGEKILATLNQTYQLKDAAYRSTPSIGVTLFNGLQVEIDVLLKQADLAMYKSKDAGRNALRFFDPDMETVVMARAALENDLRDAVQEKQFQLHYQAQVEGGRVTGSEALARWRHPQRGMVPPAEFIPLAEETGLILPLGRWVLETACTQLALWAAQPGLAHLTIAVNVSAHQVRQAEFVEQVLSILKTTGANPQRLKLELTESLLVSNVEEVIEKMFALQAKGVGFSLDDFGTGYSSLSYLKRLPLDQLKIDQSFVRDVFSDPHDAAIVKTIIALAQSLGLTVIAEGVETAAQQEFLAGAGCHAYQGYFFSKPLPIADFEQFALQT
jgi:diguanylate cyclase (GGDEF)-like protein/PAS domain S-box-containing protein